MRRLPDARPVFRGAAAHAGRLVAAALLFGLAVHWRLYPIIFALPLLRHFALLRLRRQQAAAAAPGSPRPCPRPPSGLLGAAAGSLLSPEGLAFAALSGLVFLCLGVAWYCLYGWQFLHETYLYHASRTDPRHNFSPYFYPAYLASSGAPGSGAWDVGW